MKNLLFVSHSAELNGAELMLLQSLERLDRTRFKSILVIPCPGPLEKEANKSGFDVITVPMKWWLSDRTHIWRQPFAWIWNIRSVITIWNVIRSRKIDLVLTNSAVAFSGALAARVSHRSHVWILHEILGGENIQVWNFLGSRFLIKFILALSTRVIANSKATLAPFTNSSKIHLVYNGIALNQNQEQICGETRKELGLKEKDIVLGMVGRVCPEKGQKEVVEAFIKLKVHFPELKLVIIGEIKDKKYFLKIKKIVSKLAIHEDVIFTGRKEKILDAIRAMDIIVVASRSESFGRVIIEAMSVMTPVVAVCSGGIPEIIEDGHNGFLVRSNLPADLAAVIRPLLKEKGKAAAAALKAAETIKKRFDINIQIQKIESIIEECIDQ